MISTKIHVCDFYGCVYFTLHKQYAYYFPNIVNFLIDCDSEYMHLNRRMLSYYSFAIYSIGDQKVSSTEDSIDLAKLI